MCAYFVDWHKAFSLVKLIKLMHILKENYIDWRERRVISKLYMDISVKVRLDQAETSSVKDGRRVRQGCCLSPIVFKLHSKYLTNEAVEGFGDFKI